MNERIKLLAEQANWLFADKVTGEFTDYDKRIQKFAELIVRECAEIANNVHMCRDGKVIAEDIKKHFGVEE